MSASLTTLDGLKDYLGIETDGEDDLLAAVIERVTAAIQRLAGRELVEAEHRAERHSGDGGQWLRLRHYPVVEVARLSVGTRVAVRVANASSASGAGRAEVSVTSAALELRLVGGSDAGLDTLALADHAAVSDLADAVNAVGKGWSATLGDPVSASSPAADLLPTVGRLHALDATVALERPADPDQDYVVEHAAAGLLYREPGFPKGVRNIVVDYTAGFASVPGDLEHACVLWAAAVYNRLKAGADGLRSERLGDLGQAFDTGAPPEALRIVNSRKEVLA